MITRNQTKIASNIAVLVATSLLLLPTSASASIVIDDSYAVGATGGATGSYTISSYDASASDKLVVVVGTRRDRGATHWINNVTYGGATMVEAVQQRSGATVEETTGIYYLDNPGAAGDIVVGLNAKGWSNDSGISILALSGTAPGVAAIAGSIGASTSLNTLVDNTIVIAGSENITNSGNPAPQSPLTDLGGSNLGSGYLYAPVAGTVTPTFGATGATTVAAAFEAAAVIVEPGPLLVDFNSTNQDSGPHNQAGFQSYNADHEDAADFITQSYSAFGTTVTVTPDWSNTTDNRVQQMIDRGAGNDNNWDNTAGDLDLVTDWMGIDTRTGSGGNGDWDGTNGTPTYLTLELGNLPAGEYDWKSYHHDTENVHGDFTVDISTDGGLTWEALPDGLMTDSTSGGSPDSNTFDPQGPWGGPDADLLPSTYLANFLADGTNDVFLRFAPLSGGAVHRQIWGINGFTLTQVPAVPEPSTFALATLGLFGLATFIRRKKR